MANVSHQWVLFGIDLRKIWARFTFAWQDVFMNYSSPVRSALDDPVTVYDSQNTPPPQAQASAEAFALPDSLVLERCIPLSRVASVDMDALVAAEVDASSPFRREDSVYGWRLVEQENGQALLLIALASKTAVMSHLHHTLKLERQDIEIWANVSGYPIVLEGFAEVRRNERYKKRLMLLAVYMGLFVAVIVALSAVPMLYKQYEMKLLQEELMTISAQARKVVALRSSVSDKNAAIKRLSELAETSSNPLRPLASLTEDLPDDAWLISLEQEGNKVVVEGNSKNAAQLLEQLAEKEDYVSVRPLAAIRKVGRQGVERFRLELILPANREANRE